MTSCDGMYCNADKSTRSRLRCSVFLFFDLDSLCYVLQHLSESTCGKSMLSVARYPLFSHFGTSQFAELITIAVPD